MNGFLPRCMPPRWACEWGEDSCGVFCALDVHGVRQEMRWIPAGEFVMGSPTDEVGRDSNEGPQQSISISDGFWLADTPCRQSFWQAVMGANPSKFIGDDLPVENVSWYDCQECMKKMSFLLPSMNPRFPSEAEWEYACRASDGKESAYNDGSMCTKPRRGKDPALEKLGWFDKNSNDRTHKVCKKGRNAWGLYDMHGNVWEWCEDWFGKYCADPQGPDESPSRVVRGGSWFDSAERCRSAFRSRWRPGSRYGGMGFRFAISQ